MSHVVLLGDSVFDNGAYVQPGESNVFYQIQAKLPQSWRVTMLAMDGTVASGIERQLSRLPHDASHLIVSVGGGDALGNSGILGESARSVAEVMTRIADVRESFARNYRKMLDMVLSYRLPTALCTIYDTRFPNPREQRHVVAALTVFNDVITREAFSRKLSLIDLRLVCSDSDDYANLVEPSAKGGNKIACAISQAIVGSIPRSQVYAEWQP